MNLIGLLLHTHITFFLHFGNIFNVLTELLEGVRRADKTFSHLYHRLEATFTL